MDAKKQNFQPTRDDKEKLFGPWRSESGIPPWLLVGLRDAIEAKISRQELANRLAELIDTMADDFERLTREESQRLDKRLVSSREDRRMVSLFVAGPNAGVRQRARAKAIHDGEMQRRGDKPTPRDWS